jgi:hypothetical protein
MAAVTSAVVGVVGGVATAAMSFSDAEKQKNLAKDADDAAAKAMKDARRKVEIDYYAGLTLPMDAYERQFENQLANQQTQMEMLQQGDARNLAAGVGKVGALANQQGEKTRIEMGQAISDLQEKKLDSKENINQQLIEMDVAAAKEQNQRKRDAEMQRSQSIQSGISGVTSAVQSAASIAPLYAKDKADRQGTKLAKKFASQKPEGISDAAWASTLSDEKYSKFLQGTSDNASAFKWNTDTNDFEFTDDMQVILDNASQFNF